MPGGWGNMRGDLVGDRGKKVVRILFVPHRKGSTSRGAGNRVCGKWVRVQSRQR